MAICRQRRNCPIDERSRHLTTRAGRVVTLARVIGRLAKYGGNPPEGNNSDRERERTPPALFCVSCKVKAKHMYRNKEAPSSASLGHQKASTPWRKRQSKEKRQRNFPQKMQGNLTTRQEASTGWCRSSLKADPLANNSLPPDPKQAGGEAKTHSSTFGTNERTTSSCALTRTFCSTRRTT